MTTAPKFVDCVTKQTYFTRILTAGQRLHNMFTMKTITLYSTGLAQGRKLSVHARSMAAYSNEELSIETVNDLPTMTRDGIRHLPAVAVDGVVVCEGRIPSVEELKSWVEPDCAA